MLSKDLLLAVNHNLYLIIGISAIALAANICWLWLIVQYRQGEVHMRAS
ncbi:MAG: hypothetical protein AAGF83_19830 [Cyanobacteria bacterium P01_G01_bin.67]